MDVKDEKNSKKKTPKKRALFWVALLFLLNTSFPTVGQTHQVDTLNLSKRQFEALFLKQNVLLIAEQYNIDQASALLLQAKLWPNPELSLDELNLWTTAKQRASLDQPLPPIFGNFAKNTQFSIQIEQLIQTAGKRKKRMAMEEVSVDMAQQQFEDVLRNLKFVLRTNLTRLAYLQQYKQVYAQLQQSVKDLLKGYQKQAEEQHIRPAEFIRLQALQLELSKEINELNKEKNAVETDLKILLHIPNGVLRIRTDPSLPKIQSFKTLRLAALDEQALSSRADLKLADLEHVHYAHLLQYEKAHRLPDITIRTSYNRGGGIWSSFLGFGLAIDLPLFDQNQSKVKHAKLGTEQTQFLKEEKRFRIQAEVSQGYKDLLRAVSFYESIDSQYDRQLDTLLSRYTRNFANRDISLLEYLDFQNVYLDNKKIILESIRDIDLQVEELQHIIGTDIK